MLKAAGGATLRTSFATGARAPARATLPTLRPAMKTKTKTLLKRLAVGIPATIVAAGLGLSGYALVRWDRTFDAPLPAVRASTDSAVIARGRYLAYGPALCAACHVSNDLGPRLDAGEQLPLAGGHEWTFPLGTFRSANLTPDPETGIGRVSDAELARMLRHMVRRDGRAGLPFMAYQNLSDDDLVAIISFLRSQPPVRNAVRPHDVTFLGKLVSAFLIKPKGPDAPPPAHTPGGPSVERGRYLVEAASDCVGCHTQRNPIDGSYQGAKLAGGGVLPVEGDTAHVFVTPNLTPDPTTGRITRWTEEQFVARFRAGKLYPKSYMPWGMLSRTTDEDLRSIYRYLRTVPPVRNATGESVQRKKA